MSEHTPTLKQASAQRDARLNPLALIARVARYKVEAAAAANRNERVLFSMVGLTPEQICAIAREIHAALPSADVHVHHDLSDGSLPEELLSDKTSTYWRNAPKPDGAGAVVFAVPEDERETTGASIANIVTLDTTTLIENPAAWIDACSKTLGEAERERLERALSGLSRTDLIFDVDFFARFVARVADNLDVESVEPALDRALPELRLPRDAGQFKKPKSKLPDARKWAAEFERIERETRDKLYLRDAKGAPFDRQALRKRIEDLENEEKIDPAAASAVKALLDDDGIAAGQWRPSQNALVEFPWSEIEKVFAESKARQQRQPLGQETCEFFDHWYPEALTDGDRQTLEQLNEQKQEPRPEEREFFFDHRETLRKENRKLYTRWERYIFRTPIAHTEVFSGLLLALRTALQFVETPPDDPVAYVVLTGSRAPAFWLDNKNTALCRYLRDTLRGLADLAGPQVVVDFGVCWDPEVAEALEDAGVTTVNAQTTEFKFEVYLLDRTDLDEQRRPRDGVLRHAPKGQFQWTLPAECLPAQLPTDLRTVLPDPEGPVRLLSSQLSRNPKADRRHATRITLRDMNSLLDAWGRSNGEFANPDDPDLDVAGRIRRSLDTLEAEHALDRAAAESGRRALDAFADAYGRAIRALTAVDGAGLADPSLIEQAERYGELLRTLRRRVRANAGRAHIWHTALSIGIAISGDRPATAIVTGWHPLRLAELAVKARQFAQLCTDLLSRDLASVATRGGYFDDRAMALDVYHYPAVGGHTAFATTLLAAEETLGGYTVLEPQTAEQGAEALFDADPRQAAQSFLGVCEEYLDLKPHEQANFSCVLYNAESRGLPGALSERLARKIDGEPRLRCDLTLTHDDPARLRAIYAEQNAQIGREIDSALSSEAAKSFLSRLRVGFNDLEAVCNGDDLGHAADLVLMQDVLARNAQTGWRKLDRLDDPPELAVFDPSMTSKRCPRDPSRHSSATYLTPPRLPAACQAYVDLLHDYLVNDETDGADSWLPVREIFFDNDRVARALESSHRIGEWVVNYDAIADRHLLEGGESDIRIIRHLSGPGDHHNVIVSSKAPGRQLRRRLDEEIRRLVPDFDVTAREALVDTLLDEASRISGQIVMRAARFEHNALELLGLALSKPLIRDLLGREEPALAWFFLDDVGAWLGHKAGRVADVLALSPCIEAGERKLDLVVAESKFIAEVGHGEQMRKSDTQLLETVSQLSDRFCADGSQIDDAMWRSRLADMMVEHLRSFGDDDPRTLTDWAQALRDGDLDIRVRGRSYAFVHDLAPPADIECRETRPGEVQLLIPRDEITALLRRVAGAQPAGHSPEARAPQTFAATSTPQRTSAATTPRPKTPPDDTGTGARSSDANAPDRPLAAGSEGGATPEGEAGPGDEAGAAGPSATPPRGPAPRSGHLPGPVQALVDARPACPHDAEAQTWLQETVDRLKIALREYGMDCKVLDSRLTPNAALIRLEGSSRLTPALIRKRQEELEVSHRLQVLEILKGPGVVTVMIRRPNRDFPSIREVWAQRALPETAPESNTSILLGLREDTGDPLYLNLSHEFAGQSEHQPHTLIAGMTGGGKGVLVQNLLLDICATNSPASARIWIIDPKKGLDYGWLKDMPHLEAEMALTEETAARAFGTLVSEMERRNEMFAQRGVQKIDEYNAATDRAHRLPRIYVFHDEFAYWGQRKEYRELAEAQINGLGQMARAAGIHVFLITQRPDRDVMPLQARENLGNRLALRVANENNAALIGVPGAHKLLPKGQLAASLPGETDIIYAQVPYVAPEDLRLLAQAICAYWRGHAEDRDVSDSIKSGT